MRLLYHLKDYGALDHLNSLFNARTRNRHIGQQTFTRYKFLEGNSATPWVCFLPWNTTIAEAKKLNLLPNHAPSYVYQGPQGIPHPNPCVSKSLLEQVVRDVASLGLSTFNVLAYSVGSYVGFHVANHSAVDRFVCVAPGSRLGASLWQGIATQEIRKRAEKIGIKSHQEYDAQLQHTNPLDNVEDLPECIEIHLGTHDQYIPYVFGQEIVRKLKNHRPKTKVVTHSNRGHVLTIMRFGLTQTL